MLARMAGSPGSGLTPHLQHFAGFNRVRIQLARGDVDAAARAVADLERWFPGTAEPQLGHALVAVATGQWAAARAAVRPIAAGSLEVKVTNTTAAALLVECLCADALGNPNVSREALQRALDALAPRGVARTFYDFGPPMRALLREHRGRLGRHEPFASTVLEQWSVVDAFRAGSAADPAGAGAAVHLTRREIDVLRELPSLMTVEEIAAQHVVSVNTIRTQMRSLYQKLGVRNRRDAVRRGRELGVLG
jgi:LuxR family maltose regulon positive regulatory protein